MLIGKYIEVIAGCVQGGELLNWLLSSGDAVKQRGSSLLTTSKISQQLGFF